MGDSDALVGIAHDPGYGVGADGHVPRRDMAHKHGPVGTRRTLETQVIGDGATGGRRQRRADDRLIAEARLQETPGDPNGNTARALAEPSRTSHVLIEAAQLFLDGI